MYMEEFLVFKFTLAYVGIDFDILIAGAGEKDKGGG